ncbi:hypothetical protein ACCO45_004050 [Purpureocillium lilacinum]|uniref:Uncharacterized protein n=1 Tax=Purpureocillium lilacinum TaxID=33203 RepID=A0ACC4E1P7_PURLI
MEESMADSIQCTAGTLTSSLGSSALTRASHCPSSLLARSLRHVSPSPASPDALNRRTPDRPSPLPDEHPPHVARPSQLGLLVSHRTRPPDALSQPAATGNRQATSPRAAPRSPDRRDGDHHRDDGGDDLVREQPNTRNGS